MREMTAKEIALKEIAEINHKLRIEVRKGNEHPHFESWIVPLYMLDTKETHRLNCELGL
jgi:glycine cleavage system H lipoate-binding protein